ncbi:hypothetical protein ACJ41O_004200 [Fusarium nematophilum]
MSSMFKKKGGPAFKPKIPSGRRPAAPARLPKPPPQVPVEPENQEQPQETLEAPAPKAPKATPAEAQSQDSRDDHTRQKSPPPPASIPELPKPDDGVATRDGPSTRPSESQSQDIPREVEPRSAAEARTETTNDTRQETSVPQAAPGNEPDQVRPAPVNVAIETPAVKQATILGEKTNNAPSDVLQTPTPDDSEEPSGTEPSTTPSIAPADSNESTSTPSTESQNLPKPARKPRTRKPTTGSAQEDTGPGEEGTRPKKRQRKTAEEGTAPRQPRKRRAPAAGGTSTPSNRRARSITPEDSENQVVDLQKLKMADLTRDLHIGKKFSRHDELRERERRARTKSKTGTDGERDSSATPEASGQARKTDSPAASAAASPSAAPPSGPQFRIVDGQIVVDQSSLAVDRHARAAAAAGDMETVEENDFTRLITSNSFMNTSKLRGPNIWTDEETELFYRGLRMFGTDFEMISKMFPGKQRRHVKLKYNREERHCPSRIDAAVVGEKTIKMNLEEYKAFTGSEFESVESIEAEQRKRQEEYEAEQKRIADEQAEIMRKKREELFKDDDEGDAKKRKKKKRQTVVYGLNGEPIVQDD